MAISKADFNNINITPTASKAIKWNASANGFEAGALGGSIVLISTQTASSSANLSFTSGIDSTYDSYVFKFINLHPATDNVNFTFQGSTDGGSNYNVTITTTVFRARHNEADDSALLGYITGDDLAQSTSFQKLTAPIGNGNDESFSGQISIYSPSNTTFVKHFIARCNTYQENDATHDQYTAGYMNTTSAINAVQFKMSSGNIDAGVIKLYGIGG